MKTYTYSLTVHDSEGAVAAVSDVINAKTLVAVSRAFTAYSQTVEVWDMEEAVEVIHSFELSVGEDIVHFAEAEREDVTIDAGFENAETIQAILRDILFIRTR